MINPREKTPHKKGAEILPFEPTHPGTLIQDELNERDDIKQKDLAKEMGVKPSFLNEIIRGKRPLTADYAIILEKIFGISASYWMKFQTQFEIDKARIKDKNISRIRNIEIWEIIREFVPVKHLKKYLTNSIEGDIEKVMEIYNVSSIERLVDSAAKNRFAFFRKSEKLKVDEKNMLAWVSLANYEARNQTCNMYYYDNMYQLVKQLNNIFYENLNVVQKTKEILNQYGIKFIVVTKLEKTPIDGYSFWSNDNPAIALTIRHDRIDNFAFTLMHEIGHIVLHLSKNKDEQFLDLYKSNDDDKSEVEKRAEEDANTFARENLISIGIWEELRNHFDISDQLLEEIGLKYRVNPAILLGRVCFEENNFAIRTKLNRKIG